jgi:putative endonuclease
MPGFLYILYSERLDRYYIGSTNNLSRRIEEHNRGQTTSTKSGCPWVCRCAVEFLTQAQAAFIEHKLKKLKSKQTLLVIIAALAQARP